MKMNSYKIKTHWLKEVEEKIVHKYFASFFGRLVYKRLGYIYRNLLDEIPEIHAGTILDVSTGHGYFVSEIAKAFEGATVLGLDISPELIKHGVRNQLSMAQHQRILFIVGDAHNLPFQNNCYNCIVSTGAIHHWDNPQKVFTEIYRILKPDGIAIIVDQIRAKSLSEIFKTIFVHKYVGLGISSYPTKEILDIVSKSPFKDFKFEEKDFLLKIYLKKKGS